MRTSVPENHFEEVTKQDLPDEVRANHHGGSPPKGATLSAHREPHDGPLYFGSSTTVNRSTGSSVSFCCFPPGQVISTSSTLPMVPRPKVTGSSLALR